MKLDIGKREPGSDGWTTVDAMPGADLVTPMWYLRTLGGPVSDIRAFHVLEHAPRKLVGPTLREWHRVLIPGGRLEVEVPSLEYACRLVLSKTDPESAWRVIYGSQVDAGMYHFTGFTTATLRAELVSAGFEEPEIVLGWSIGTESIVAVARKA